MPSEDEIKNSEYTKREEQLIQKIKDDMRGVEDCKGSSKHLKARADHRRGSLDFLRKKYEADRAEAVINLESLRNFPAGIGDHPIAEEQVKWFERFEHSDSCLKCLEELK